MRLFVAVDVGDAVRRKQADGEGRVGRLDFFADLLLEDPKH